MTLLVHKFHLLYALGLNNSSQTVVSRPEPQYNLEMGKKCKFLGPTTDLLSRKQPGWGSRRLCLNKPRGMLTPLKRENQALDELM